MLTTPATEEQVRAVLIKCRAQLDYIVRRSQESAPGCRTIDRARQGEFTEIVIHAVITGRALREGAGHFKSLISRAYAKGVAGAERTPTLDSVRAITAVLDETIASLSDGVRTSRRIGR
jgi:hypothetical protein